MAEGGEEGTLCHDLEAVHLSNEAGAEHHSGTSTHIAQSMLDPSEDPTVTDAGEQNQAAKSHIPEDEDSPHSSSVQKQSEGLESESNKDIPLGNDCDSYSETSVHQSDNILDGTSSSQSLSDSMDGGHLEWTLLSLPGELLLKIFDYLDPRQVIGELSLVCKAIHAVVSENLEWKVRFRKRWRGTYPVVPVEDDDFNWKQACIEREESHHRWAGHQMRMDHFSLTMAHIAAIDCVHLMHNAELCATGSRDRSVQIWDLRKLDASNPEGSVKAAKTNHYIKGHKGWVWDITSLDHHMCTASWDCWMKVWDVNNDMKEVRKMRGKSAFLSVVYQPDLIIAGAFDKSIYMFDPRVDDSAAVGQLIHHKRSVLTVAADDQYIISGGEDKNICIYDRRAAKLFKTLKLQSFCMCMSYQHGQLWTGHRDGKIRVIDPTHGNFDIVQKYDVGHEGKITGIINTLGALYTCSTDATIRINDPKRDPDTMCKIVSHNRDITAIDLQCGVLASACSDLTAGIWRPRQDDDA